MRITVSEIAKRAGVSSATVSRALNDRGYVSEDNKKLILKVAEELDYSPKQYNKRKAKGSQNNIIGLVVPDIQNPYYTDLIRHIEKLTFELGYDMLLCDTNEDPNQEIRYLSALLCSQLDGLIIAPVSDAVEYNAEYLREVNKSGTPVVLLGRDIKFGGMDGVFLNNYDCAYQATQAFIDCGHRQIAILCGPTTTRTGLERLNGYFAALRDNSIPIREEYVLYGNFKMQSAYELTQKLMATKRDVTAIFTANNTMAEGCVKALSEIKAKFPDDMAIISFGNLRTLGVYGVDISYISLPSHLLALECVKILTDKINVGKKHIKMPPRRVSFFAELVLCGSEKYVPR